MPQGENGIMLLVACAIAGIVGVFAILSVARTIYNKTGHNCMWLLPKLLMYVEAIVLTYVVQQKGLHIPLLILVAVGFIAVFAILHLKAGIQYAITLGVLQGLLGSFVAFCSIVFWLLSIALRFMPGCGNGLGRNPFSFNIAQGSTQSTQNTSTVANSMYNNNAQVAADARNAAYAETQARREAQAAKVADAVASNYGFSNAQEARDSGIDV